MMSDDQIEKLLKENLKITKDNSRRIKKIQSYIKWGRIFKIIYWIIIIGSALGVYWLLQPYMEGVVNTYHSFGDFIENPKDFITDRLAE